MSTDRRLVLLDTDIGSDIDDALCLSYLLRQPRCELLGVTTVSGNDPRVRASLVDAMCRAEGRTDIPIHAGAATSLVRGTVVQPEVPQAAVLARHHHRPPERFASATAVDFLHQTISEHSGAIDLLAIGPMTNLALLFARDPLIASRLRSLVVMCGAFNPAGLAGPPRREWNALCDPEATEAVYCAAVASHCSVGLDVTEQVKKPTRQVMDRCERGGGALGMVAEMAAIWSQHVDQVVFHDPLAATLLFAPEICCYQDGEVRIEVADPALAGHTRWGGLGGATPHRIAVGVDPEAFFREYEGVTFGPASRPGTSSMRAS